MCVPVSVCMCVCIQHLSVSKEPLLYLPSDLYICVLLLDVCVFHTIMSNVLSCHIIHINKSFAEFIFLPTLFPHRRSMRGLVSTTHNSTSLAL